MLPNLNHLTSGLQFLRRVIDSNTAADWTGDSGQHAAFLTMFGGTLPDDAFRMALTHAVQLHHWDEATVAQIVRAAIAVDELTELTGSTRFRPDPAEMAKAAAAAKERPLHTPVLPDSVPFPSSPRVTSVLSRIQLGIAEHNAPFTIPLGNVLIAAQRGAGKTVLLNNVIAGVAQTVDATAWVGDTDFSLLAPWLRDDLTRRMIGWPAVGVEETVTMLDAALELIKARKARGAAVMAQIQADRYPISNQDPAVVIVLDAESITQHPEVWRRASQIRRVGGVAQVYVVSAASRATADYIGVRDLKLSRIVIAGRLDDEAEYAWLTSKYCGHLIAGDLMNRHCRFIGRDKGNDQAGLIPFQATLITPDDILHLGMELSLLGHTPPLLPDPYRGVTGYMQRWEEPDVQAAIATVEGR